MRTFGDWLREAREARGIATQSELRSRLRERGYPVTKSAVCRWEAGSRPSAIHLEALFSILDIPTDARDAVVLALAGRRGFPVDPASDAA